MAKKAELRAVLKADNSDFIRKMKQSGRMARDLAKQFARSPIKTTALAGVLGVEKGIKTMASALQSLGRIAVQTAKIGFGALVVGGSAAAAVLAHGVKGAYELGAELDDMGKKTGIAVDQLMILNQAAKDNGVEDITGSVKKMQKSLVDAVKDGAGPASKAFALLGLDANKLATSSPADALQQIGDKINAIQNPALRTAAALEIFGKQGSELLPLFANSGALGNAAANIGKQASILQANAEKFHAVSVALSSIGLKIQGFFVGIAEVILPMMQAVAKQFQTLDLANQGERFGSAIKTAVEYLIGAFKNPRAIFDAAKEYLTGTMISVGNLYTNVIRADWKLLSDSWLAIQPIVSSIGDTFRMGLMGAMNLLRASMLEAAIDFKSALYAGIKVSSSYLGIAMNSVVDAALKIWDNGLIQSVLDLSSMFYGLIGNLAEAISKALAGGVSGAISGAKSMMDAVLSKGKEIKDRVSKVAAEGGEGGVMNGPLAFSKVYEQERNSLKKSMLGMEEARLNATGKMQIEAAKATMDTAAAHSGALFKTAFDNLKATQWTEDILGASKHFDKAANLISNMHDVGSAALAKYTASTPAAVAAKKFTGFQQHSGMGVGGGLRSGGTLNNNGKPTDWSFFGSAFHLAADAKVGLRGSSLDQQPFESTPFFTKRERNRMEAGSRAEYMATHNGQTPDGITRRGDHRRMQEFQRGKEREKYGVEKSNQLLTGILGATTGLADAWGASKGGG